jgi:hypothetical protein
MHIGLHVKYPLFLSDFDETGILGQIFEKCRNIKFHENPSIESRIVPADGRADIHDESNRRFSQFWKSPEDSNSKNSTAIPCTSP